MELSKEYAGKGVAGAGLGTGIAGLSLGVLNSIGGIGALSGLFGGGRKDAQNDVLTAMLTADMLRGRGYGYNGGAVCGGDCDPVTQREMKLLQEIAAKDSAIALRDANTYNDQKSIELYKYIDGRFREFEAEFARQAVKNQATQDSFQMAQERLECCCREHTAALESERRERRCNDDIIISYVNGTFYPQQIADVTTASTSSAKRIYNPLPACGCDCNR